VRAALYLRTVARLRPAQVAHRGRLRGERAVLARAPRLLRIGLGRVAGEAHARGWPPGFVPLDALVAEGFPSAEENAQGRFRFLEEVRALGDPPDWPQARASQLWRYHLHYFEWAWALAAHPDRDWARRAYADLWRSWRAATTPGQGDAWSPYVVSLRAWSWCGVYDRLVAGSPIEAGWLVDLAAHRRAGRALLELDVGGNHLVKNLKALTGLGVFWGDEPLVARACRRLARQLAVQVLADGGHFERSPSYHCQVLGDLLDVAGLLAAAGLPPVPGLEEAVGAMRRWLGVMLMPDGDVPLFNDCTRVGRPRIEALQPVRPEPRPLHVLQPSGYAVLRGGDRLHLVADIGPPCPPDLPAHAQADCLSFELAVDGERLVVDSGTSTYAPGPRRAFERSTAAHNTVEVDGADQTEVWGVFRAARLARPILERASADGGRVTVTAAHDGYRRLPGRPRHRRTWTVGPESVEIVDEITGRGVHSVRARIHARPGVEVDTSRVGPFALSAPAARIEAVEVAERFGALRSTHAVVVTQAGELPISLPVELRLGPTIGGG